MKSSEIHTKQEAGYIAILKNKIKFDFSLSLSQCAFLFFNNHWMCEFVFRRMFFAWRWKLLFHLANIQHDNSGIDNQNSIIKWMIISTIDKIWNICRHCFPPNTDRWWMQIYSTNYISSGNSRVYSHCIWWKWVRLKTEKCIKHLLRNHPFLTCPIYLIFITSPFFQVGVCAYFEAWKSQCD